MKCKTSAGRRVRFITGKIGRINGKIALLGRKRHTQRERMPLHENLRALCRFAERVGWLPACLVYELSTPLVPLLSASASFWLELPPPSISSFYSYFKFLRLFQVSTSISSFHLLLFRLSTSFYLQSHPTPSHPTPPHTTLSHLIPAHPNRPHRALLWSFLLQWN